MKKTYKSTFKLSREAELMMKAIAKRTGLSLASVIEMSIRAYADKLNIAV